MADKDNGPAYAAQKTPVVVIECSVNSFSEEDAVALTGSICSVWVTDGVDSQLSTCGGDVHQEE